MTRLLGVPPEVQSEEPTGIYIWKFSHSYSFMNGFYSLKNVSSMIVFRGNPYWFHVKLFIKVYNTFTQFIYTYS